MSRIDGPTHGPQNGGNPKQLVVLLHGYGADGNDLIGLAPVLAPLMPGAIFVAPNAPYPCDGNPMGFQWFPINRLDPASRLAGTRSAAPFIDTFLDDTMAKYGLEESKTALVDRFSQGTMMVAACGPASHQAARRYRRLFRCAVGRGRNSRPRSRRGHPSCWSMAMLTRCCRTSSPSRPRQR